MTSAGLLQLVPATTEHALILFNWHNDAVARKSSLHSESTPWPEHVAWLDRVLSDPDRHLFIAMVGEQPVGQVRIDTVNETDAELSLAMDPELRGQGLGPITLRAAVAQAGDLGFARAVGVVRLDNPAGLRYTEKAGWVTDGRIMDGGVELQKVFCDASTVDDPRGKPVA